jgi:hypothetical protein
MIELQDTASVLRMADWVELSVMFTSTPLSKAKISSLINASGDTDIAELEGDDLEADGAGEQGNGVEEIGKDNEVGDYELFDSILQELDRRRKLYGDHPPYTIENNVVMPGVSWQDAPELFMCLLFAYWGAWNKHSATKLFERLSNEVLVAHLDGQAVTLGFPNPENLSTQLDTLAALLFERRGNRNPEFTDKDRGVDVVGWKSFNDSRNGQIVVLMQCAAGRTWESKKQIPLPAWSQYINWNYTTTLPCMSVTEIITSTRWQNRIDEYGILFDRARIYQYLYRPGHPINQPLRDEILDWCTQQV